MAEQTQNVTLKITGMTCAACAARIEKGLNKLPGVEKANVNLAAEKASVSFDPSQTTVSDISAKIEDLGYQVIKDRVDLKITGMTCAACAARIEKGLNKLPGVYKAVVNLAAEKSSIEYEPARISQKELKAAIEKLGYGAHNLADAKEADAEKEARDKEMAKLYGDKGEIAWGSQIRSYVLQPYQLVKDLRTNYETSQTQDVLDGDIHEFILAELRRKRKSQT